MKLLQPGERVEPVDNHGFLYLLESTSMCKVGCSDRPMQRVSAQRRIGYRDTFEKVTAAYISTPIRHARCAESAIHRAAFTGRWFPDDPARKRPNAPLEIYPVSLKDFLIDTIRHAENGNCGGFAELLRIISQIAGDCREFAQRKDAA